MKSDVLSLKSIYQFLTVNDYPVYSGGIITKKNHAGLTLTKFWRETILFDFRSRKCGRLIWRNDGGRNRYVSDICNRSGRLGLYREYAEEICDAANAETLLRQIGQFQNVLAERQYNYETFSQKLPAFLQLIREWDESFSEDAAAFFTDALEKRDDFENKGAVGRDFYCCWFLSMLMLHALAGNGEGEEALRCLRQDSAVGVVELGETYFKRDREQGRRTSGGKKPPVYLTGSNTELCSEPLSQSHFLGREEEMFDLREMLEAGGRYLISGIGGIGKTELMRQLLKCCEEDCMVDYICAIQYEESLAKSFVKAFTQIHGVNMESNFAEVLANIRAYEGRMLIIIDNMNRVEDKMLFVLEVIPATIFVTSRCQSLKGFETYTISTVGRQAGSLIFRDNYSRVMTQEDRRVLADILKDDIWRHTLTLRLLGRAAAERGWSLARLQEHLGGTASTQAARASRGGYCSRAKTGYAQ